MLVKLAERLLPDTGDNLFVLLILFGGRWLGINAAVFSWINRRIRHMKATA